MKQKSPFFRGKPICVSDGNVSPRDVDRLLGVSSFPSTSVTTHIAKFSIRRDI